ncbi:MAG TPA: secondary thiamine-phosphate synthase enzyme YjbQ [bacterium]
MMKRLSIVTTNRIEISDITALIRQAIRDSGVLRGICTIYVPHTTSAITINENSDPAVKEDLTNILNKVVPADNKYLHTEGNSDAHIKASLIGASQTILVENGKPVLGTWQSIFFCEFDGPRTRSVLVKIISEK